MTKYTVAPRHENLFGEAIYVAAYDSMIIRVISVFFIVRNKKLVFIDGLFCYFYI